MAGPIIPESHYAGGKSIRPRNPCYTCSKPKLVVVRYSPRESPTQLYKCPHNPCAPGVWNCPHYEREPGTDDFLGDPENNW